MINLFIPNKYVKSVFEISPKNLQMEGIRGIITDLDNTLVPWDMKEATPKVKEWFQQMKENNIKVTIISNNNRERVTFFAEPLETNFVYSAKKPLRNAFIKATKEMNLSKDEVVVIGDQLLTDVLGGNMAGFKTILVVPIVETDGKITKINRKIERFILKHLHKKGKISWEE